LGKVLVAGALSFAAALLPASQASGEAALALGLPADVAKQGLAVGWAINQASRKAAEAEALRRCRELQEAPQATRDLCRIVESFNDRCLAVAVEPEAGTTGIGWAVAKDRDAAEEAAMEDCAENSSRKRGKACRVELVRCDAR
jgi:hypothetical protein